MTAKILQCTKQNMHPSANALYVYEFSDQSTFVQIVANEENIYSVGDNAVIVMAPSIMKDGTKIKSTRIRGVASQGMAIGKSNLPVGTDVTEQYCVKALATGNCFVRWPDIVSLFNVRKFLRDQNSLSTINYRGKIKLDGTNCGIQVSTKGDVYVQSRSRIITADNDNMGCAAWALKNLDYFQSCATDKHIIIFGEYCGIGIQKGTAIASLNKKILAVFAIQQGNDFIICPDVIRSMLPQHDDIYVLPWYTDVITLDYSDEEALHNKAEEINNMVSSVEKCDPWVKDTFGIEGIGEGLVMYPIMKDPTRIDRLTYSELVFKAKGDMHKVVKTTKSVQINPEKVNSISEFVDLMVTENRLNQIAQRVGNFSFGSITNFLRELGQDVKKESTAELEAANIEWKDVSKSVTNAARMWYIAKCKEQQ